MNINILLPKELQQFVDAKLRSGRYTSPNEVVRDGLRLLEDQDKLKEVRRDEIEQKILVGVEQLNRNEGIHASKIEDELRRSGREDKQKNHG